MKRAKKPKQRGQKYIVSEKQLQETIEKGTGIKIAGW